MKYSIATILLLSMSIAVFATAGGGSAQLDMMSSGDMAVSFELIAGDPVISAFEAQGREFLSVEYDGAYPSGEQGHPELPVLRALVQIPFGATPRIEFREAHYEEISLPELGFGAPVRPVREPWVKLPGFVPPYEMDERAYSRDSYQYPSRVEVIDISTARSYRLALIEVRPVDYNPVGGTISIARKLAFDVYFDNADLVLTRRMKERYSSKRYDAVVKPLLANPTAFEDAVMWLPAESDLGYLIVAGDIYADSSHILADWKRHKGYSVKVRTVSELGGTREAIRSWIIAEYDTAVVAPTFVLLVGDIEDVPSFEGGDSGTESDLPYGDMDDGGYIPELFVGRISIADQGQLGHFLRRIIQYEQFDFPPENRGFANKVCFMASDDVSWWEFAQETQRYKIDTYFGPAGFHCDSIWARGNPSAGDQSRVAVEDGRTIVSYTGHGGYYLWDAPEWSLSDVRGLSNVDQYPLVLSNACITGTFRLAECFGEAWIRQENAGSIGFIGASDNSYWLEDDAMERATMDDVFGLNYRFAGGFLYRGLLAVHIGFPGSAHYYYDIYNLLGDPSLAVWLGNPQELIAIYPPMLSVGGVISVNVTADGTPVDSALVCATDGGVVHSVGYTDASGNITLSVAGAGMGDTIWVTATYYDMIPHLGFAIIGGGGAWFALDSIVIDDSAGDGDGMADIGEEIALTVFIKNIGGEDAVSVQGILRTADDGIELEDTTGDFGAIAEGSSASNAVPFTISLDNDIPDGTIKAMTLLVSDEHDSSWNIPIGLRVHAPRLSIASHSISDTIGGDGDGFLQPGESAELTVVVRNTGGETARFMALELAVAENPYVTVTTAMAGIDSIAPSESKPALTPFVVSASPSCPDPYMIEAYVTASDFRGPGGIDTIIIAVGAAGFAMDCESGPAGWMSDGVWHLSSHRFASPSHSWYSGIDGEFMYRDNYTAELITPEVAAPVDAVLSFWHYYSTEERYDSCQVHYSTNGGASWNRIAAYDGPDDRWRHARFDLSSMLTPGAPVMFKFSLSADIYCGGEGWFIDDIVLSSPKPVYLGAGGVEPFAGDASTDFRFIVTCSAPGGGIPSGARVVINGVSHGMTIESGAISTGARFQYTTNLVPGDYSYHYEFYFLGDTVRFPETGQIDGPFVSDAILTLDVGSSAEGITSTGARNDWEYGAPTTGPGSVPIGTNCWATQLHGDYSDSSRSRLILPAMNLSGMEKAFLCWYQWYRFQSSDSHSYHDGGNIKIAVAGTADTFIVHPQNGYDGTASRYNLFIDWEPNYGGNNTGNFWHFEAVDLTPWAGNEVTVLFDFGSSSRNVEAGWFINNIYLFGDNDTTGIAAGDATLPKQLAISAHPNPFNSAVALEIHIPEDGGKLRIFDIGGRQVADLSEGLSAGKNTITWSPDNLPSGIYFARVVAGGSSRTETIVLLK